MIQLDSHRGCGADLAQTKRVLRSLLLTTDALEFTRVAAAATRLSAQTLGSVAQAFCSTGDGVA